MWAQLIIAALGIWVTAAPAVLGYAGPAAAAAYIVGPTIASFALIAVWGVMRAIRWVNVPLGLWLMASPWILDQTGIAAVSSFVVGAVVASLSTYRGRIRHPYGGGWRGLFKAPPVAAPGGK